MSRDDSDVRRYVVDEEYRNSMDPSENEYSGWLNEPLDSGGINGTRGITNIKNPETDEIAFVVFYSSLSASQSPDPWEDSINLNDGVAYYWGDAKAGDGPDPANQYGNRMIQRVYAETYAKNNRGAAPPILLFQKERPGWVLFKGLCTIAGLDIKRHRDEGEIVVNYRIKLDVLDADAIPLDWVHERALEMNDQKAPDAWKKWVSTGEIERYSIIPRRVRSKAQQLPSGDLGALHGNVRAQISGTTTREQGVKFEILLQRVLETMGMVNVELTENSGDKGVDLRGDIRFLEDANLSSARTRFGFKAQAKNNSRDNGVGGKDLSRLASRVDDGELGLFFTMSYFTEAAQEESAATYPLRLFSGRDIMELLVQTDLVSGNRLDAEVVADIDRTYGRLG